MTLGVMERSAGNRFGPYEIVGPLGSGGMGEVYRATDLRLHRDVALKILTAVTAEDSHRQRRFLQEARAASSLNHPNILVVYDIGNENGSQFIVSELVEGESLRSLIQKGPMPLRRFLDIAIQVASGLTSAHEAGIVHRDLKPENIMIGRDNHVKILDFGLAKVALPETGSPEEQTRSHMLTVPGAILGTVAYMSPEQARGSDIDFRSDQFSFGLILYEMATGQKAFHKNTPVQTLSAIIAEDPPSISSVIKNFPAPIRWMIERCLAKDPRDRYGATIDLYHELRDFREHLSEGSFSGETAAAPVARKTKNRMLIAAAVLLAAIGGFLAAAKLVPRDIIPLASYSFTPIAVNPEMEAFAAWSPDGGSIAYVAEVEGVQQLFVRSLSAPSAVQVTHSTTDILQPNWSPDGARIYFSSEQKDGTYNLMAVGIAGGSPELVLPNAAGGTISKDGKTIVFLRASNKNEPYDFSLWSVPAAGGEPKEIQKEVLKEQMLISAYVSFAPDGKRLFVGAKSRDKGTSYWLLPFPGGEPEELEFMRGLEILGASWMPDGKRLVISRGTDDFQDHHLWMADLKDRCVHPITNSVSSEWSPAVSPDGRRILFSSVVQQYDLMNVSLDGAPMRNLTDTPVNEKAPSWSPRGNQFAYVSDITGSDVIWVKSETEGWQRPLVTQKDFPDKQTVSFSRPAFSPDGRRIVYHRNTKASKADLWISNVAGGAPVRLFADEGSQFAPSWSPDGNWVAFLSGGKAVFSLVKVRVGSSDPPVVLQENVHYFQPQWSPDGSWILFMHQQGASLVSMDGKSTRKLSDRLWLTGGWSQDGKSLYSVQQSENRRLLVLSVDAESGAEKLILDAGVSPLLVTDAVFAGFTLAPDGKSFATSVLRFKADLWILEGFDPKPRSLFWFLSHKAEDGKEKAPR